MLEERLQTSEVHIADALTRCPAGRRTLAIDVGCGEGWDAVVLARHFDRVVAIDPNRRSIGRARQIAQELGVSNVEFRCGPFVADEIDQNADFVYCNLMSHHTPSRLKLLEAITTRLETGGWLVYSEATEAYAPLEIDRALATRDVRELYERVRQAVNGLLRTPGFRFFFTGTAQASLARKGFTITDASTSTWRGLPYAERITARLENPSPTAFGDRDYDPLDPQLARTFDLAADLASGGPHCIAARSAEFDAEIRKLGNTSSAYVLLLRLLQFVPTAWEPRASKRELVRRRLKQPLGYRTPDWASIAQVHREFVALAGGSPLT